MFSVIFQSDISELPEINCEFRDSCLELFRAGVVHRNCLIFGTKLELPNATEVTFSDFVRKILFGCFWTILVKKAIFGQKSTYRQISQNLLIGSS